jgi:hypothetical protein
MYCPECRSEFRDDAGLTACVDCGGPLLAGDLPAEPEPTENHTELDLATVLETGDPGLLGIAHSLLDEAGIPYTVPGEGVQELFGAGRIGTNFNLITGPIQIQVRRQDEAAAKDLLADLGVGSPPEVASAVKEETD